MMKLLKEQENFWIKKLNTLASDGFKSGIELIMLWTATSYATILEIQAVGEN